MLTSVTMANSLPRAADAEADRIIQGQETVRFENRYRRKDGSYRRIN
jgi:hypothetical protein